MSPAPPRWCRARSFCAGSRCTAGTSLALLSFSLVFGTAGFHYLAGQAVIDALLNSAMLLGGMGPVGDIQFTGGKLFASFYSLYAGLVFIGGSTLLLAPVLHRFMHRFHLEDEERDRS